MRRAICLAALFVLSPVDSAHAGPLGALKHGAKKVGHVARIFFCGPDVSELDSQEVTELRLNDLQSRVDFNAATEMSRAMGR